MSFQNVDRRSSRQLFSSVGAAQEQALSQCIHILHYCMFFLGPVRYNIDALFKGALGSECRMLTRLVSPAIGCEKKKWNPLDF
jgi:hypothetical protein